MLVGFLHAIQLDGNVDLDMERGILQHSNNQHHTSNSNLLMLRP